MRKPRNEQMSAGLPPIADIARRGWHGRKVPYPDLAPSAFLGWEINLRLPVAIGRLTVDATIDAFDAPHRGSQSMFRLSAPCVLFAGAMLVAGPVLAEQRLPTIAPEQYTADQKKAAEEFL